MMLSCILTFLSIKTWKLKRRKCKREIANQRLLEQEHLPFLIHRLYSSDVQNYHACKKKVEGKFYFRFWKKKEQIRLRLFHLFCTAQALQTALGLSFQRSESALWLVTFSPGHWLTFTHLLVTQCKHNLNNMTTRWQKFSDFSPKKKIKNQCSLCCSGTFFISQSTLSRHLLMKNLISFGRYHRLNCSLTHHLVDLSKYINMTSWTSYFHIFNYNMFVLS